MSSSSVFIEPLVPGPAVLHKTQSSGDFINKNAFMTQILPNGQGTDFSFSGNNQITFQVSSNTDFWDLNETHLSFEYTTTATSGGGTEAATRDQFRWCEGGALNVIKNMRIETTSGVVIENYQGYNKLRHILSCVNEEPEFVDRVKCKRHDSMNEVFDVGYSGNELRPVVLNAAAADGIGMALQTADGVTSGRYGLILQPVNDNFAVVNQAGAPADEAAVRTMYNTTTAVKKSVRADSAQQAIAAAQRCSMKLDSGFMSQQTWFPLMLTKGLQIVIELENPAFCFTSTAVTGANAQSFGYTLLRPKLYCRMVTPSASLVEQYTKAMNDGKLNYTFGSYDRSLYQHPAGVVNASFQVPVSRRSISHTLSVIQNPRKNVVSNADDNTNTFRYGHRYIKANATSVQWQQGSDLYPISGAVELDRYMVRPYELLLEVFGKNGIQEPMRMRPYELQARNVDSGNANESHKLILGYRFSRDFSPFTGIDTSSGNFIQLNIQQSVAYATALYIYTYVGYDAILSITKSGVIVRK
jgi:hypothetical protein